MTNPYVINGPIQKFLQRHERCDLVRVLTCGSVDDGKSTLIGRLLLDASVLPKDTLAALEKDSKQYGTQDGALDPALLIDGLKAEREQKITIDVAHRFFSSEERTFIVADTPGHEQYTRNMVTAASNADMVIILLDARNGVLEQSRRHAFIASLLGIKHAIVAVNKMDLVDFSEDVFEEIKKDFLVFAERLQITDLHFVPLSALSGDNVMDPSTNMPWYKGGTLMHLLNTIHVVSDRNLIDFRFPVQYVSRPSPDYRAFSGTVASGSVRPGDEVLVLPSHKTTRVQSIDTFDGELSKASALSAVTLRLEDNIDISRGDMIVPVHNVPEQSRQFDAFLVWMDEESLQDDKEYIIKHTTKMTTARIRTVRYVMDVNTLRRGEAAPLTANDIGRCALTIAEPLPIDSYERNRITGSFVLIDPVSHQTSAAGMIVDRKTEEGLEGEESSARQTSDFPILWLTGNTGSGKSTLAQAAERHVNRSAPSWNAAARKLVVLDGDELRETISLDEDLSAEGRRKHNLRTARLAKLLQQKGFLVVVSVIAPFESLRKEIDAICKPQWIYVERSGITSEDRPYDVPSNPDFTVNTDTLNEQEGTQSFIDYMVDVLGND
ncbi:MAG: sulfate adenylyltransferase subunit CysN [Candidatus Peribacter sp.]|jgi:bifunctional enzyme CysN/CysC|nr:sulfate adenylyltransferase subunit CysN [Candidatus Peribacter sp.]MBT4393163.1 sulfate adenylyltransferase subunit CysN [Candidatus Peribacter sp.]MBT4600493.1 sulfate adenylyltransferase subunit CysN [Candidatus Peribacter sp.]MBT5148531.1 sulfate adenylyltransferase subunit CysN [Candidatus Peribacter sp.]MBT5638698.1 sulfate adenylyltransferase subunit CysN [Candidatus Peribacter sp.]